jgi:hypothetical protein
MEACSATKPRARKRHCCSECSRTIEPGETYERTWGKFDGGVETYKTCVDCLSVRDSFFCDGWGYTVVWQDLQEHLSEVVRFGDGVSSDCMAPLTKAARDKVCDLIEEIWEDMDDD